MRNHRIIATLVAALCACALALAFVPVSAVNPVESVEPGQPAEPSSEAPISTAEPESSGGSGDNASYVPGEAIVQGSVGEDADALLARVAAFGYSPAETEEIAEADSDGGAILRLAFSNESDADDLIAQTGAEGSGITAQHNYIYRLLDNEESSPSAEPMTTTVNDEYAKTQVYPNQYYLYDTTTASGITTQGIKAFDAWDKARCNDSVTVAVLDTGCRMDHEDLVANLDTAHAWDAVNGTKLEEDPQGHGTHVCGIIGGVANNGKGIAGVSYNARVLPINVFQASGTAYSSTLVTAYDYLEDLIDAGELSNLHVVNMSLGGYDEEDEDLVLKQQISSMLYDHDVLTVCAGGNGDSNNNPKTATLYPSDFEECISVTALERTGTNVVWSDYNMAKDLSAPGRYVYSTTYSSSSSYGQMSGTSQAAPIVSGIAALLFSLDEDISAKQVRESMEATATPVYDDVRTASTTGSKGAVDAAAAVNYALGLGTFKHDSAGWRYVYYNGSYPGQGWKEIDGKRYYFTANGYVSTGLQKISGKTYYFGDDGAMRTGLQTVGDETYCFGDDGVARTGWQEIDGKTYYFSSAGIMQTGYQRIDGTWYCFGDDGASQGAWQNSVDEAERYAAEHPNAALQEAIEAAQAVAANASATPEEVQQAADALNAALEAAKAYAALDDAISEAETYASSYSRVPIAEALAAAKAVAADSAATPEQASRAAANLSKSLSTAKAEIETGGTWKKDSKGWWYQRSNNRGYPKSCWSQIGGKRYHFNASGYMQTGWLKVSGKWYYLNSSGAMTTGWQKVSGKWYYLDPGTAVMKTGWQKISGTWYYLNSSGAMATGWQKIGGKWYWFKSSGAMATGWIKTGGKWYYLSSSGAMVTGTQKIGGKTYKFNSSGVWIS